MNIGPSEARNLSLYDYQAVLWHWNDNHTLERDRAPDPDKTMELIDLVNADPRLTGPRPEPELAN